MNTLDEEVENSSRNLLEKEIFEQTENTVLKKNLQVKNVELINLAKLELKGKVLGITRVKRK